MDIGSVIKKYRKESGFTQEEMANRLGVTTPAVNKWENGNSKPDIDLLAPIARLLHISLDTLLAFRENLTDAEIEELIREMEKMFSEEGYEKTYQWAVNTINEYPNCNLLIWQIAVMLDSRRILGECENPDRYDDQINSWYELALNDENESIQHHAADSLFGFYLRKQNYEMAEKYLNYFSDYDHPHCRQKNLHLSAHPPRWRKHRRYFPQYRRKQCHFLLRPALVHRLQCFQYLLWGLRQLYLRLQNGYYLHALCSHCLHLQDGQSFLLTLPILQSAALPAPYRYYAHLLL